MPLNVLAWKLHYFQYQLEYHDHQQSKRGQQRVQQQPHHHQQPCQQQQVTDGFFIGVLQIQFVVIVEKHVLLLGFIYYVARNK